MIYNTISDVTRFGGVLMYWCEFTNGSKMFIPSHEIKLKWIDQTINFFESIVVHNH